MGVTWLVCSALKWVKWWAQLIYGDRVLKIFWIYYLVLVIVFWWFGGRR